MRVFAFLRPVGNHRGETHVALPASYGKERFGGYSFTSNEEYVWVVHKHQLIIFDIYCVEKFSESATCRKSRIG